MATSVTAHDGALDRGARVVAEARAELHRELTSLRNQLSGLGGQWAGQGSVSFHSAMARWDASATRIVDALTGFEENLTSSSTTYTTTDDAQHASFAAFAARLG
jgi:WXG100 family type VII secretion target